MKEKFRRYFLPAFLLLVLFVIVGFPAMTYSALAAISENIQVFYTPDFNPEEGDEEDPGHSYGIYMEAGEAHPAWRMAAVLPYIAVFVGLMSLLGVGFSVGGLVTGAVLIILTTAFVPIIWYMIP